MKVTILKNALDVKKSANNQNKSNIKSTYLESILHF